MENRSVTYCMDIADHGKKIVEVHFDKDFLSLAEMQSEPLPDWVQLDFQKCAHCPLEKDDELYCPAARSLVHIVRDFGGVTSHLKVSLKVSTPERDYMVSTDTQTALSSLIGLILPFSGCPHTAFLKPMARFHLPVSSLDETMYRASSMFALAMMIGSLQGGSIAGDFTTLSARYDKLSKVNASFSRRLQQSGEFREVNAIALLDVYAQIAPMQLDDSLANFAPLFDGYADIESK